MAHLHLLLAADSSAAILIKHGPGSGSCTVGWDREQDTFQMGQCLRHRVECPDISPDGQYFSYSVNTWNPHRKHKSYRVISLSPWLKARAFWATGGGDPHPGSSLFLLNNSERPNIFTWNPSLPKWDYLDTKVTSKVPRRWEKFLSPYFQWQRDGWSAVTSGATEQAEPNYSPNWEERAASLQGVLEKSLPHGWKLQMARWCGGNRMPNRSTTFETFALVSPQNEIHQMPDWISADFDAPRGRVVWTADNILYSALVREDGLEDPKMLWDGRDLRFTAIKAPY